MLNAEIEFLVHFLNFYYFAEAIKTRSHEHQSVFMIRKRDDLSYVHVVNASNVFLAQVLELLRLAIGLR